MQIDTSPRTVTLHLSSRLPEKAASSYVTRRPAEENTRDARQLLYAHTSSS